MMKKKLISHEEAHAAGYRLLCGSYTPSERQMLDNVIADMERGKIDYALVGVPYAIYVGRRGMKILRGPDLI